MADSDSEIAADAASPPSLSTSLSVVVHRDGRSSQQQLRLGVAARIPRKRETPEDTATSTIRTFLFWDDQRGITHLDSLLTQLAPLRVVYLGCTEKAEAGKSTKSLAAERKAKQVRDLLEKIAHLIDSRNDISSLPQHSNDQAQLTNLYPSLPSNSPETLSNSLEHLLTEPSFLKYRGMLLDNIQLQALSLLLHGEGMLGADVSLDSSCEIMEGTLSSRMLLDRTASEAIHLLPPTHAGMAVQRGGSATNSSLLGILNRCQTPMGSRQLQIWLRQPLVHLQPLLRRQNAVTTLVEDTIGRDRLREEGLAGMGDLDKLAQNLSKFSEDPTGGTAAALACLYKLHLLASQQLPLLHQALQDVQELTNGGAGNDGNGGSKEPSLLEETRLGLEQVLNDLAKATDLVEAVLDMDQAPREFLVKPDFNEELQELRQELDDVQSELQECHEVAKDMWTEASGGNGQHVRMEQDTGSDQEWRFRLPNTNDEKVLRTMEDINVHKILKNGVYFSTKPLRQACQKRKDIMANYEVLQRDIVVKACEVAGTYTPVVERASALVAQLDVVAGFAHAAAYSPNGYCKPELTDGDEDGLGIELKAARHPCVELQENMEYIPNDIKLIFGESSFLFVTGPNMGGKSSYIRSLGAIVTMAQVGSYVPCESAKINLVHHILARVGAGDAQNRGISTFMAEMLEASSILSKATKRSLIIIDELGRGTSTYDGFGLASAISEYLVERVGCMTVFATHFHELTSLEAKHASVQNCHVTAQSGDHGLTFLYEVRSGPCLESFGIQVAEMANVPKSVVEEAKRQAKVMENFKRKRGDDAAVEFCSKFRRLPVQQCRTEEERKALFQKFLKEHEAAAKQSQ